MASTPAEASDGVLTLPTLLAIVVAAVAGILLGLLLTIRSLDLNTRGIAVGAWRGTPQEGMGNADPYALATNARTGLLPLGAAEGLMFLAITGDDGAALDGRCDYLVKGPVPNARYWTLSLVDRDGFPVANPANRYGFTSAEILRFGDAATVEISANARSGNWLPSGDARAFMLMLRLYDTSLSTGRTAFDKVRMPSIARTRCR